MTIETEVLTQRQAEVCLLAIQGMFEVGGVRGVEFSREILATVSALESISSTTIEAIIKQRSENGSR